MTDKEKRPSGRDQGLPVPTTDAVLAALADTLDGMTVREIVRLIEALRRRARKSGRKT